MSPIAIGNGINATAEATSLTGIPASQSYEFRLQKGQPQASSTRADAEASGLLSGETDASGTVTPSGAITPPYSVSVSHDNVRHFFGEYMPSYDLFARYFVVVAAAYHHY